MSVLESTDLGTDVLKSEGAPQVPGGRSQTVVLWGRLVHLLKLGLGILTVPGDPILGCQVPHLTQHCCKIPVINSEGQVNGDLMGLRESFWTGAFILTSNCADGSVTLYKKSSNCTVTIANFYGM